jgi:hypothetical protein
MCFVVQSNVHEIECLNISVASFARIEDMNIERPHHAEADTDIVYLRIRYGGAIVKLFDTL